MHIENQKRINISNERLDIISLVVQGKLDDSYITLAEAKEILMRLNEYEMDLAVSSKSKTNLMTFDFGSKTLN